MKRFTAMLIAAIAALALTCGAIAETVSFDGKVTAAETIPVYTPLGGVVETICVQPGQTVQAGDVIATLRANRVTAAEDGTVAAVFGQIGDAAPAVAERYGAVVYIEGTVKYTVSTNLGNAYRSTENTFLHPGQTVYLRSTSDYRTTGTGIITTIDKSNYAIDVDTGSFIVGETVSIYNSESLSENSRIGQGKIERRSPLAVSAEAGTLVNIAVKPGDKVARGQLLFETLPGTCEPAEASREIIAPVSGTVSALSIAKAALVSEDTVVAEIYPDGAMQIEGSVSESDLSSIHVGSKVTIALRWNEDTALTYDGEVTWISAIADPSASSGYADTTYTVCVSFTPDADTRFGMNASVELKTAGLPWNSKR